MKKKKRNKILVVIVSFLLIIFVCLGIYYIFMKTGESKLNISSIAVNISNELNFDDIKYLKIDNETANKIFELESNKYTKIEAKIPIVNSLPNMYAFIEASDENIEYIENKIIEYGNKYQAEWEKRDNEEQLKIVKNRIIGKKENIVYIIVSQNAKNIEAYIK